MKDTIQKVIEKLLVIKGTGAMTDYDHDDYTPNYPWFVVDVAEGIGHIYIEDGVESIG